MAEFSAEGEHKVITGFFSYYEMKAQMDRENHMFQSQMVPRGLRPRVHKMKKAWDLH